MNSEPKPTLARLWTRAAALAAGLMLILAATGLRAHDDARPALAPTAAKYVILLIGDGMGPEQVKAARYYSGGPLAFEALPYRAQVTTASADSPVTDSAAAATAMATGRKVDNGVISMAYPGNGAELDTLLEVYQARGRPVGLVTTTYMTHATPAAFGAHEPSRNNLAAIAGDYLAQSRPDVLFGGGGNGLSVSAAVGAGYTVVTDRAAMQGLDTEAASLVSGQFGDGHLPYEYDGDYSMLPHLAEMTLTALAILDNEPAAGFFLMVEAGRIDHAGHDNHLRRNIHETLEFSQTVQAIVEWVDDPANDSNWANTLLAVTADHETGGLTVTQDNGPGQYPSATWSTGGHTGVNVDLFARGTGAEQLAGATIDNSDIFDLLRPAADLPPVQYLPLVASGKNTAAGEILKDLTGLTG